MNEMIRTFDRPLPSGRSLSAAQPKSDGDFSSPEDQEKMKRREVGKNSGCPRLPAGSAPKESDGQ